MELRTRTIHFAQDNTAQATPGARPGATGEGIIIYNGSGRILPFKNTQAYIPHSEDLGILDLWSISIGFLQ